MRADHILPIKIKRNLYYPFHGFDPSTLPLEVSINVGDKIWIGKEQPTDTITYKLWIYSNIKGYETTIGGF